MAKKTNKLGNFIQNILKNKNQVEIEQIKQESLQRHRSYSWHTNLY